MCSIIITVYTVRAFLMCVFVIDRFLSIFAPYFYPRHSKKLTISLCVTFCVITCLLQLPAFPGLLDCYGFLPTQGLCLIRGDCSNSCSVFRGVYFSFVIVPTTLIPIILYAMLCWKVKKIKRNDNAVAPVGGEVTRRRKKDWKATITFFLLFLISFF